MRECIRLVAEMLFELFEDVTRYARTQALGVRDRLQRRAVLRRIQAELARRKVDKLC